MTGALRSVDLMGMELSRIDSDGFLDHLFAELEAGRGGWAITANLDFMRRYAREPQARSLYDSADVRVADGMPLVWACALQGDPLPERVAGSSLIWGICERAAQQGRRVYLLGGAEGAGEGAERVLTQRWPELKVVGRSSPMFSTHPGAAEVAPIRDELTALAPDILLVGLGSPKQEHLIAALRDALPRTWMMGVGISFSFVAGEVQRAPEWMRRSGLEWVHRMAQEPRRLMRRYLVDDLPFAAELFTRAALRRVRSARRDEGKR